MKLYDNDAFRDQFMDTVYDLLAGDPDNNRANQIISAFDSVPALEALSIEIPFEKLPAIVGRSVYVVCWSDPGQSGWAVLRTEEILDELFLYLKFPGSRRRQIRLTAENYHNPWVICSREPTRPNPYVFVSGDRYRRLEADYTALKQELDALKTGVSDQVGIDCDTITL